MHKKLTMVTPWIQIAFSILSVAGLRIDTPKGSVDFQVEKLGAKKVEGICRNLCNVETAWTEENLVDKNIKKSFDIGKEPYDSSVFPHLAEQLHKLGYEDVPNHPLYGIHPKNILWIFKADDKFSIRIEICHS